MIDKSEVKHSLALLDKTRQEISKIVVDQHEVVNGLLKGLLSGGHVLVEGLPGLAKTLIVRTMATVSGCQFNRIQFTADLLPSDIIGITSYEKSRGFYTIKGPVFSHFILADEINRAPPKVQAALLESMQEGQVTIGGKSYALPQPFFVFATENPIETLGVYPLPEAQIDRFLFKVYIQYPSLSAEVQILQKNITLTKFNDYSIKPILNPGKILHLQRLVKEVYVKDHVMKYIITLIDSTRNPEHYSLKYGKYIQIGAGPRGSIGLYIGAKAHAFLQGRTYVTPQDVKDVALDVLRHRILVNYEGQANAIKSEMIIEELLKKIKPP